MKFFLGVDLGTTNIKAVLFDEKWTEVFTAASEVNTSLTQNGYCEQDPESIALETDRLLDECLAYAHSKQSRIEAIGLSAAMHSFLAVDKHAQPITQLIIWSDTRATEYARLLKSTLSHDDFQQHLNVPLHPALPLLKWIWFNAHKKFRAKAHKIISLKDYILFRWFGKWVTDVSLAGSTGYFDISSLRWNSALLNELHLDESLLPEVLPVTAKLDSWTGTYCKKYGISVLPPVVIGSSDGCLANLSAGVMDNTTASLTIGTSGAVRTTTTRPGNATNGLFCYPVFENYYVTGGAANNGGNVMHWLRNNLNIEDHVFWKTFESALSTIPAGSDQLLFVPYLFGERAPIWDPGIRASFLGLSGVHGAGHLIKSCAEGIAFSLKHILSNLINEGNVINTIVADGGFTRSDLWVQLTADVSGVKIEVPFTSYGAAFGAALVARMTVEGQSLTQLEIPRQENRTFIPNAERKKDYESLFAKYLEASAFLQGYFSG